MFKIYIKETPLYLTDKSDAEQLAQYQGHNLVARYVGKPKLLLSYADMLEKGSDFDRVILYTDDLEQLYQDFTNHYQLIEAAGGLVLNPEKELLMIFRMGHWDLPKGKIEKGEQIQEAAVREVEEETGIKDVSIKDYFHKTFHFYRDKQQKRALKISHWYLMEAPKQQLIPQTEEEIELAEWVPIDKIINFKTPIYGNIIDLVEKFKTS